MNPELAAVRADLYDALVTIPDVTVYAHEPDAVDLPAVWIEQTAGTQGVAAPVVVAGWDVVIASETLTATDTTDLIDDLIGVVLANVAGVANARFESWQRADRDVAGTNRPTATVSWMTDHILC